MLEQDIANGDTQIGGVQSDWPSQRTIYQDQAIVAVCAGNLMDAPRMHLRHALTKLPSATANAWNSVTLSVCNVPLVSGLNGRRTVDEYLVRGNRIISLLTNAITEASHA